MADPNGSGRCSAVEGETRNLLRRRHSSTNHAKLGRFVLPLYVGPELLATDRRKCGEYYADHAHQPAQSAPKVLGPRILSATKWSYHEQLCSG